MQFNIHCDTFFSDIEPTDSCQTTPRPSTTQEPQVGGGCSWGLYRHVSEQYNSHKTHVEGPGSDGCDQVAGGKEFLRTLTWVATMALTKNEKKKLPSLTSKSNITKKKQKKPSTIFYLFIIQKMFPVPSCPCHFLKRKNLQVDSRRTWEVSKFITRNVEIARKGGVVPDNLVPQPAPVAPAPIPPVKEESKPTGYPKTEAKPDPVPQKVETVPSVGWIFGVVFGVILDGGAWLLAGEMVCLFFLVSIPYSCSIPVYSFQRNNPPRAMETRGVFRFGCFVAMT